MSGAEQMRELQHELTTGQQTIAERLVLPRRTGTQPKSEPDYEFCMRAKQRLETNSPPIALHEVFTAYMRLHGLVEVADKLKAAGIL